MSFSPSHPEQNAYNDALDVVKAALSNSSLDLNEESGKAVAAFFKEIYNVLCETSQEVAKHD